MLKAHPLIRFLLTPHQLVLINLLCRHHKIILHNSHIKATLHTVVIKDILNNTLATPVIIKDLVHRHPNKVNIKATVHHINHHSKLKLM